MRSLALFLVCLTGSIQVATAQDIQVTWGSQKSLDSYPSEVNGRMTAKIVINDVNDYLYTYTQTLQATPRVISDASQIFNVGAAAAPASREDCSVQGAADAVKAINTALSSDPAFNPLIKTDGKTPASPPRSINVSDTQSAYRSKIAPQVVVIEQLIVAKAKGDCVALYDQYKTFEPRLTRMRAADSSDHTATGTATLNPDNDYQLTIAEFFDSVQTDGGYKQFTFSPTSNVMTLSAGVGLTTLQSPSYTVTAVPSPTGSTSPTQNILAVGDTGTPRPIALGLLNYQLVSGKGNYWSRYSWAISSGPVLQGSGKSDLQTFGFFAGVSTVLFHRLFLTPGVHIGQFADLPAGFSANQVVPSGIGSPTPVKRWEPRFAFGFTYKVTSLGNSKVGATDTSGANPGSSTPKPTKKPAPQPANNSGPAPQPANNSAPQPQ